MRCLRSGILARVWGKVAGANTCVFGSDKVLTDLCEANSRSVSGAKLRAAVLQIAAAGDSFEYEVFMYTKDEEDAWAAIDDTDEETRVPLIADFLILRKQGV
eukprot:GHVU01043340.1.p2 GENE.GHVU01043340.1~~GHVU01043340.1.p2  ORF type:complete len:102 (+),score=11.54 GHVU01043340.1:154-459(+)